MKLVFNYKGVHPRVNFFDSDIEKLKARLETDERMAEAFKKYTEEADKLLTEEFYTEAHANAVYSQHGNYYDLSGQIERMAEHLGLLYSVTKDMKYAEKMKACLIHYAPFNCWTGPYNKDRIPPQKSDLATAGITRGYAYMYDCICHLLTAEEKKTIVDAMMKNGVSALLSDWVLPGERVHCLDSMGHNWWAVCIAAAAIGLIAVYEEVDVADEWMTEVLKAMHGFCTFDGTPLMSKTSNFDDKGLFYESNGYFNYGAGELMKFAFVFSRLFENGKELTTFDIMEKVPTAFMAMSYPTSDKEHPLLFTDFGDSGLYSVHNELPRYTLLWGADAPEFRYAYHTYFKEPGYYDFLYPDILGIWAEEGSEAYGSMDRIPTNMIFDKSGYAYMRTSWEKDATLLAVRCGYSWNHAHADPGHFVIFADGAPVITDSGNCGYGKPQYISYYQTTSAHNVIEINGNKIGEDCHHRGLRLPGKVSNFVDGEMKYLLADATGPYCQLAHHYYRHFMWLTPDILVVLDEIRAIGDAEFASLLHFAGDAEITADNEAMIKGKTPLRVKVTAPDVKAEKRVGLTPPTDPDKLPEKDYLAFVTNDKQEYQCIVSVYTLHDAVNAEIERLESNDAIGAKIVYGGETYEILFNKGADGKKMHDNSSNTLLGYDTDAYILAKKTTAEKETLLAVYASYIRKDGKSIHESLRKVFKEIDI